MAASEGEQREVEAVRRFNRVYTRKIGILNKLALAMNRNGCGIVISNTGMSR